MKSIQQTEQLSDRELKAVLRGDEASLGSFRMDSRRRIFQRVLFTDKSGTDPCVTGFRI